MVFSGKKRAGQSDEETPTVSERKSASAARRKTPEVNEALARKQQERRYRFLLEQTDLFEHFINVKRTGKSPFQALLERVKQQHASGTGHASHDVDDDHRHHRKSEKEEDAELLAGDDEETVGTAPTHFSESPAYVKGGKMRSYQIEGLNWMISLYENGINGILADEMGLGKTLQTLSLLGYLKFYRDIPGPHLLIVPKSTLQNWLNESRRWVPGLDSFVLHGTRDERKELIETRLQPGAFDVCITSYEMCLLEKSALSKIPFRYIAIDEAHRIKNEKSSLSTIVRAFHSTNRLLITGTPLQNNLHELWALLNFLLPDIFSSSDDFDAWFGGGGDEENEVTVVASETTDPDSEADPIPTESKDTKAQSHEPPSQSRDQELMVQQMRRLLEPFLLRRLKADVEHSLKPKKEMNLYVGLSDMQRRWYQKILERDLEAVNGLSRGREGKTRLLNIVMQLRKCANHPYLFDGAEPGPPYTTDMHLVANAGKMQVLDRLLARLRSNGSRVLLFSQMSRMLDIFEDYCVWRGFEYCRIDGQTEHVERVEAIDEFNRPGSSKFIFLLTTRAGGLGINLATADSVVLYDSDWNPQVDLQAQDRAHRIGQLRQVTVFRLITEDTVEEKVIERALQKLRLDQLVIQQGRASSAMRPPSTDEMLSMIRHGAERIFRHDGTETGGDAVLDDAGLEEVLKRGEARTRELLGKYQNAGLDDLQRFSGAEPSLYRFEGADYSGAMGGMSGMDGSFGLLLPARRERRAALEGALRPGNAPSGDRPPLPKLPVLHDFQFFPAELSELFRRETRHHQRTHGYRIPAGDGETEERKRAREAEQHAIDTAEPLSRADEARKQRLIAEGFADWSRRDFSAFVRGCERFGRDAFAAIAAEIESKGTEDVRRYSRVFWRRVDELPDAERLVSGIEKGETRLRRNRHIERILADRMSRSDSPPIPYALGGTAARGKHYTPVEDEFLLRQLHHLGYSTDPALLYPAIHAAILAAPVFKFDFFLKTRTVTDLTRRCHKLISIIEKEAAERAAGPDDDTDGRKRRAANREPWERLAEKAAHGVIQQLKSRRSARKP